MFTDLRGPLPTLRGEAMTDSEPRAWEVWDPMTNEVRLLNPQQASALRSNQKTELQHLRENGWQITPLYAGEVVDTRYFGGTAQRVVI